MTAFRVPSTTPASSECVILQAEERRDAVLEVIRSAQRRILLSFFRCTDFKVIDELGAAAGRGVRVALLLTPRAKGWKQRLEQMSSYLVDMGAEVRRYAGPVGKYHAKYLVADDAALVASLNFTHKCFTSTCDFLVVTRDAEVVRGLETLFAHDWETPRDPLPAWIQQSRLIVGPEHSRARIEELFQHARRSIRIVDHKLRDPAIIRLLAARERDGVEVRVLGRGAVPGLSSHGKLFLLDEDRAVIGSMSLARGNLDGRREAAIVVDNPALVARLSDFFLKAALAPVAASPSGRVGEDEDDDDDEE